MNGTAPTGGVPERATAARELADQLADLSGVAQRGVPDLLGALADAEQKARRLAGEQF
jgi:hypothetical protein